MELNSFLASKYMHKKYKKKKKKKKKKKRKKSKNFFNSMLLSNKFIYCT